MQDSEIDEKIKLKKFETEINSYKVDKVCEKDINHENIVKNEECVEKASPVKINSDKVSILFFLFYDILDSFNCMQTKTIINIRQSIKDISWYFFIVCVIVAIYIWFL